MVVREQADILNADTIGDGHQLAHLWCRLAPIEPFCKHNPVLIVIAERAIEVVHGGVVSFSTISCSFSIPRDWSQSSPAPMIVQP